MEFKHFSHTHSLIPHQVPQESQITCSGCKSPGNGSVYACWICNYFLHEQCFQATRSLTIPTHPLHPLNLVPYPTYPSNSFYCNSCNLIGSGFSYSCSFCEFDLHVHCAYMLKNTTNEPYPSAPALTSLPNQTIPQYIPAPGHPPHNYQTAPISNAQIGGVGVIPPPRPHEENIQYNSYKDNQLPQADQPPQVPYNKDDQTPKRKPVKHFGHRHPMRISQVKEEDSIICSCCEEDVLGSAYSCTKSNCDFYLHESCFGLTREIKHESHLEHPLTLLSSPAYKEHGEYTCNACFKTGTGFVYHCNICSFDLHVSCASLVKTAKREDHEHPLVLLYTSPLKKVEQEEDALSFSCDVCNRGVDDRGWLYYCQKCDFGTHVDCVGSERESPETSLLGVVLQNQQKMQLLQMQMEMSRQNAQLIANMGQSMLNLV